MKRYMALIHIILGHIEQHGNGRLSPLLEVSGYTPEQAEYHLALCEEAGFIRPKAVPAGVAWLLTWQGHEELARSRAD